MVVSLDSWLVSTGWQSFSSSLSGGGSSTPLLGKGLSDLISGSGDEEEDRGGNAARTGVLLAHSRALPAFVLRKVVFFSSRSPQSLKRVSRNLMSKSSF